MRNRMISGAGAPSSVEAQTVLRTHAQGRLERLVFSDVQARLASVLDTTLTFRAFGPLLLTLCAAILWITSLKDINVRNMTDLGLISVLPPMTFVALIILTISFCLALHQKPLRVPVLLLNLVVLIVMLYGITALIEEEPRFAVTWRHAGFTEYITRTGTVAPELDARFNWPTFFILSALVTQVAGLQSVIPLTAWASVFFNLLYLGPLVMILSSVTKDRRLVWLGVWFFYLTNWIGQDYFAPQALNYFLYLVILGVLLKWFKARTRPSRSLSRRWQRFGALSRLANRFYIYLTPADIPNTPSRVGQRASLVAIIVAAYVVVASSHQLTPFFVLVAVAMLVVFMRVSLRGLPIAMAVIAVAWIIYMAVPFLAGHMTSVTGSIGQVQNTVSANVGNRFTGSPDHLLVLNARLLMTAVLWGLAFLGGLRRIRSGYWDMTLTLLAAAPFTLMAFQDYGGELLLRTYLFILPFVAFFAAALFYTTPSSGGSWRTAALTGLLSVALLGGFFFTRYGNERMDYTTHQEVDAVRYLYSIAKPGSVIAVASSNLPWKFQAFEEYYYSPQLDDFAIGNYKEVVQYLGNDKFTDAYLLLTRSEYAYGEMFYGLPADWGQRLEKDLLATGKFKVIYANEDAKIMTLVTDSKGDQP